jgi:malonate-semialdehyde dehydrogenase (acetylating) / methylmalonate-semialdehyde dehydrogenase
MSGEIRHWIGGQFEAGISSATQPVFEPATGKTIATVQLANQDDVAQAVNAAAKALPAWAGIPPLRRARVLFNFRQLVEQRSAQLAEVIAREHGKIVGDAAGEIQRGLEVVEFACGIPHLLKGDYTAQVGTQVDSLSLRQPLGVVAGITPFNFPVMVPMWMFPVAIACGNTFILKPSERDPSASLLMGQWLKEAGLPDGVFNVVQGDRVAVDALLDHPGVRALSFVGSTPIAQYIYARGAGKGKRVQALGGAKNHMVVLRDANIPQAADALIGAAYGSAGERCMAISVAVVEAAVADELIAALRLRIAEIRVGASQDAKNDMGPLVTRAHLDKVLSFVDTGVAEGAELVIDGRNAAHGGDRNGFFMGPCLFDRVSPTMRIYKEEIFGPVLSVVRTSNAAEALALVNAHEYGNGAVVFTESLSAATEFMHGVETGMVGINVPIPVPMAFHSFGGWKQSLFGDHHIHGEEGVRFYTRLKTVTTRWRSTAGSAEFTMPTMK